METSRRDASNLSETKELSRDLEKSYQSTSYDTVTTESSNEEDEENKEVQTSNRSQNRSKTISPERNSFLPEAKSKKDKSPEIKQNTRSYSYIIFIIVIIIAYLALPRSENKVQTQSIDNLTSLLSESIESVRTTFYNQEADIWNDISSAINEVISRTPKKPSIILLFAKETTTMDCLAIDLARVSSTILHGDGYLVFNPIDFGNDAGEIITTLKEHSLEKKKVVVSMHIPNINFAYMNLYDQINSLQMIRDILKINAEAIKALHNLCDRINPLVAEAIYILTMQTNSYPPQQKKLNFVEEQIYNELSKSIDQDILMALVTRITDGAIISVQPEPKLKYC